MGTPKKLRYRMAEGRRGRIVITTEYSGTNFTMDSVISASSLTWYATGDITPLPAAQEVLNPSFNLSNNTGLVNVVAAGASGTTEFQRSWIKDVHAIDITDAPALERFDIVQGYITELDLRNNPNLIRFSAARNSISNIKFGTHPSLVTIELDYNNLGSQFLTDIYTMPWLTTIIINSNGAGLSSFDYTQFPGLFNLNMSSNGMSGAKSFSSNTALTHLKLGTNPGVGSVDVTSLTLLQVLFVQWCGLSSLDVTNNINLTELRCHLNNLSSLDVSNCTSLSYLSCQDNGMDSTNTDSIWNQMSTIATNGNINNGTLIIRNNRTTAADAAFANLSGRGWTLTETID